MIELEVPAPPLDPSFATVVGCPTAPAPPPPPPPFPITLLPPTFPCPDVPNDPVLSPPPPPPEPPVAGVPTPPCVFPPVPPPIEVMVEKTESLPLAPATDSSPEAAPPAPTVIVYACAVTVKPVAVRYPPAPPPPAPVDWLLEAEPPEPPPAMTKYSTEAIEVK